MTERSREVQRRSMSMLPIPLFLLLFGDMLFVILHVIHRSMRRIVAHVSETDMAGGTAAILQFIDIESLHQLNQYFANPLFNIEMDNGYAEHFQHLKFIGIIMMLCYLCIKNRIWSFLPWALLFTYFLLDDALRLHEQLGYAIAQASTMAPPFGLRMQDVGELIVVGSAGLIILPSLLLAYYFGQPALRRIYRHLAFILGLLIFFGVGVDMLHTVISDNQMLSNLFGLIEDGGEMLAVSIFGGYILALTRQSLNLKEKARQQTYHLPGSAMAAAGR